jgi:methionyl aminopeptidase
VATTVILGEQKHESNGLLDCARQATLDAVSMSLPGTPFNAIGKHIEDLARVHDFTIIRNLCSHGVGKSLHTHPQNILNYYDADETMKLTEGMVIAWEPYLSTCACRAIEVKDNDWNLTTHNQSEVAQFEHTVLVTQGAPEILTLLK